MAPTPLRFHSRLVEALGSPFGLGLAIGAYLLTPGHPASAARGLPLQPEVTAMVLPGAFVLWGFWRTGSHRVVRIAASVVLLLTIVKIAMSVTAPEWGALATYHAHDRFGGAIERSTEFPQVRGATRVDRQLSFTQESLPVHFFNDNDRFNFYEPNDPDRQRLPLAVRWDGWVNVGEARTYRWWLTSTGTATLTLDGSTILGVIGGGTERTDARPLDLAAGTHALQLEYVRRGGQAALIELDWDGEGDRGPMAAPWLTTGPLSAEAVAAERIRAGVARLVDWTALLAVIVALVGLAAHAARSRGELLDRMRPLHGIWGAAVAAYGAFASQDLIGRAVVLEGGQDWLTYEYYARDILLNGPLMTLGKELGQGKPFVFQPLYPYALALIHAAFGEGLYGPQVSHFAMLGATGIVLWHLGRALFGSATAWTTLGMFTMLIATQLGTVAHRLLSENLYFPLLLAALLAHLIVRLTGRVRMGGLAGALLGVASLTRAPTLLLAPPAALLLVGRISKAGIALFLIGMMAVIALAPIRNYLVSGRPTLVATNAGATLLLAHTPTPRVRLAGLDRHPVYNFLRVDRPTREVLEFVRQDPVGYAATLVPLALYTLGFPGAVDGTSPAALELVGLVLLYLAAVAGWPETRRRDTWLTHAFIVSHFLVMITFLPYVYGYRQVLPMYLAMLPITAVPVASAAARLVSWRWGHGPRRLIRPT